MDNFMRVMALFMILLITNISLEYQNQTHLSKLWKKSLSNKGNRKFRRQGIITSVKPPTTNVRNVKVTQGPITNAALLTTLMAISPSRRPSVTLQKSPVTSQRSPVTEISHTTSHTKMKESQHVVVPEPVDVIPVRTVPPQRFIPTAVPPTSPVDQYNTDGSKSDQTQFLLPNLPVYNVSSKPQDVKPVIPVKEVPEQTQIKTDMNPIEPLPIMTRPTVTILQHVIGQNPTRATLQSVVVPKRKEASPPSPLTPLPVLHPHTVAMPLKPLPPLAPLPPQEPHIIHHIPIPVPNDCHDPYPCGCDNNCNGK